MACPLPVVDTGTRLLLEQGMYDLALIDHAAGPTDRIKRIMMAPGVFERALQELVADRPDLVPLPSGWFSYSQEELYRTQVALYTRTNLNNTSGTQLAFFGVDLGTLGGHYAAYYVTPTEVDVHDSMTTSAGPGPYARFFLQLAKDLFPDRRVRLELVGNDELGLQPTGGFMWLPPSFMQGQILTDPSAAHRIQISNIESQDHFCWSWSLLYLHSRVMGYSLRELRRQLRETHFPQVVVIKVYSWLLLTWLGLDTQFPVAQQIDYFTIWDANDRLRAEDYRRYQIDFVDQVQLQSIDDCFWIATNLEGIELVRHEALTNVPAECLV